MGIVIRWRKPEKKTFDKKSILPLSTEWISDHRNTMGYYLLKEERNKREMRRKRGERKKRGEKRERKEREKDKVLQRGSYPVIDCALWVLHLNSLSSPPLAFPIFSHSPLVAWGIRMSSYVAVLGKPTGETSCIFGLTPQEIRYLQVRKFVAIF